MFLDEVHRELLYLDRVRLLLPHLANLDVSVNARRCLNQESLVKDRFVPAPSRRQPASNGSRQGKTNSIHDPTPSCNVLATTGLGLLIQSWKCNNHAGYRS